MGPAIATFMPALWRASCSSNLRASLRGMVRAYAIRVPALGTVLDACNVRASCREARCVPARKLLRAYARNVTEAPGITWYTDYPMGSAAPTVGSTAIPQKHGECRFSEKTLGAIAHMVTRNHWVFQLALNEQYTLA